MRFRLLAIATLTLSATVPGLTSASATPAQSGSATPAQISRESGPQAVSLDRASTASAAQQRSAESASLRSAGSTSAAAVDAATYLREKAAAKYGPAPTGPAKASAPSTATATMPTIFNGLDKPGAVNNGFVFEPPDTIVGKSPNRVLEGVNSALRLYNNTGGVLATRDLNSFYGASTTNGLLFDPKVYYDRNAPNPRFYVVALQVAGRGDTNAANDVSRTWVAVSRSPDPSSLSSGWCRYNIGTRRNDGTSDVSWADYPSIGAGANTFSFAMNQFRFTNDSFTFAIVHVWNKAIASNNASSCPSVPRFIFQPSSTIGDFSRFTIQPAQHYTSPSSFTGTTNPAYYLSTRRGSSNEYRAYRVRNVASGSPTMAQLTLTGTSYGIPPSSPQPSGSGLIDTGDNRMLQVAGIADGLVGIFTTVCQFTSGTSNESCTLTPRVLVGQNSSGGLTASLVENTFAGFGNNIFVHHPSVARNINLQLGSTWEFSGSSFALSSASMTKNVAAAWTSVLTYASGSCSRPGSSVRSGDYSGAQTDPSDLNSFWLAGEQSVVISDVCQWRTRIGRLVP